MEQFQPDGAENTPQQQPEAPAQAPPQAPVPVMPQQMSQQQMAAHVQQTINDIALGVYTRAVAPRVAAGEFDAEMAEKMADVSLDAAIVAGNKLLGFGCQRVTDAEVTPLQEFKEDEEE
jgi:hypothetical protein